MKWIAGFLLSSVLSAGAASAGTVTGVQGNAASVAVGAVLSVTVSGTNPCGAAHINYGDGTAITYAITGLPVTQTHTYDKPGTYAIVARGMGNCDGEATTRVQVTGPAPPQTRSALLAKWRYRLLRPIPASRAMSSMDVCS